MSATVFLFDSLATDTTEVTVVDRTGHQHTPTREARERRPGDELVERIVLRCGHEEATFLGAPAWRLAALMLRDLGYRAGLGLSLEVSFSVRFGDGVNYTGTLKVSRSKRPDLAAWCRTPEAFQQSFAPDMDVNRHRGTLRSMLRLFLKTYEIPTTTARIAAALAFTTRH